MATPAGVITDPVTGNQYIKNTAGTYVRYTPTATSTPTPVTLTTAQKSAALTTLGNVTQQLQTIQSKVSVLKQAEQAGISTTGKTVQQVQAELQPAQTREQMITEPVKSGAGWTFPPTWTNAQINSFLSGQTTTPTATSSLTPAVPVGITSPAQNAIASPTTDSFSQQLFDKLSKQLDIISSQDSEYTKAIQDMIGNYKTAQEKQATGIESYYSNQEAIAKQKGEQNVMAARESMAGLGAASTFAMLDRVNKSTEQSVNDLESRKQEALATGQMEYAQQISAMQLQAIQMKQDATQQAFSNLLSVGNLGLQVKSQQLQAEQVSAQEKQNLFDQTVQQLSLLKQSGGSVSDTDISSIAGTLGISESAIKSIVTKPNTQYLGGQYNSNDGTYTIFQEDQNTGKVSTQTFKIGSGASSSVGGYSTSELKLIRSAGLDPSDTSAVDTYLRTGIVVTEQYLSDVARTWVDKYGAKVASEKASTGVIQTADGVLVARLSPEQTSVLMQKIGDKAAEDVASKDTPFFSGVGNTFNGIHDVLYNIFH